MTKEQYQIIKRTVDKLYKQIDQTVNAQHIKKTLKVIWLLTREMEEDDEENS